MRLRDRITRPSGGERRAIIDIGSNTVRMVVYGGPLRAPAVLFNEKVTARLGRGVAETGLLSDKARNNALTALGRYAVLLGLHGVSRIETVATAAVRDASNGAKFLDDVRALGLEPRLLSGEEEATTSASGVIGAFPSARGVVADLGGGSLELVHIGGGSSEHGASMPLGTLRLPALRADGSAAFAQRVKAMIHSADWLCAPGEALYLVGGSHRALARYAMELLDWPLDDPHGLELTPEQTLLGCRAILRAKTPPAVRGLSSSRLGSLADTAALLAVLLREAHPLRLVFSSWGLREGLLFNNLTRPVQAQDPLLAGVAAFADSMGMPAADAAMVAGWTANANPAGGVNPENLRLAATMLALSSHRIEPNMRAELAADWALRKRWIGVDAAGRAVMAAAVLANCGSSLPESLSRLASPESLSEAQIWGLAIRLCRRLSGVAPQALSNSALSVSGSQLVLEVREPYGALVTDLVEKDMRLLADRLALQPHIRLVGADAPAPA